MAKLRKDLIFEDADGSGWGAGTSLIAVRRKIEQVFFQPEALSSAVIRLPSEYHAAGNSISMTDKMRARYRAAGASTIVVDNKHEAGDHALLSMMDLATQTMHSLRAQFEQAGLSPGMEPEMNAVVIGQDTDLATGLKSMQEAGIKCHLLANLGSCGDLGSAIYSGNVYDLQSFKDSLGTNKRPEEIAYSRGLHDGRIEAQKD
uniref:Uncharacterized protein n=1 Tax=Chromera velia CCMP2878 TaxID=1169474 RepID=A0A0G4HK16_9ALVE|eukprot:Cvel_7217.t1-p1 / transcript=Cvel_7217.t1 / gene=Cvel_7217 / organism=Chromera_velia_CCMP2878 / gene_product=hypothetical protein / transcript_product=hypothetical protein / location=Cvel_scaffold372:1570-2175(+) / protein_length=202 / sequence_SO=supercontig / SO=protein_coding / is_pseudo=false